MHVFGLEFGYNLSMETSRNDSDLDALPAAIKAAFLAERTARIGAEARADQFEKHNDYLEKHNGHLEKHNDRLEEYATRLEGLVFEYKRALFGKKSERLDPDQLVLAFEDLETAIGEAES